VETFGTGARLTTSCLPLGDSLLRSRPYRLYSSQYLYDSKSSRRCVSLPCASVLPELAPRFASHPTLAMIPALPSQINFTKYHSIDLSVRLFAVVPRSRATDQAAVASVKACIQALKGVHMSSLIINNGHSGLVGPAWSRTPEQWDRCRCRILERFRVFSLPKADDLWVWVQLHAYICPPVVDSGDDSMGGTRRSDFLRRTATRLWIPWPCTSRLGMRS
jgi:hypothetical protein